MDANPSWRPISVYRSKGHKVILIASQREATDVTALLNRGWLNLFIPLFPRGCCITGIAWAQRHLQACGHHANSQNWTGKINPLKRKTGTLCSNEFSAWHVFRLDWAICGILIPFVLHLEGKGTWYVSHQERTLPAWGFWVQFHSPCSSSAAPAI